MSKNKELLCTIEMFYQDDVIYAQWEDFNSPYGFNDNQAIWGPMDGCLVRLACGYYLEEKVELKKENMTGKVNVYRLPSGWCEAYFIDLNTGEEIGYGLGSFAGEAIGRLVNSSRKDIQ